PLQAPLIALEGVVAPLNVCRANAHRARAFGLITRLIELVEAIGVSRLLLVRIVAEPEQAGLEGVARSIIEARSAAVLREQVRIIVRGERVGCRKPVPI